MIDRRAQLSIVFTWQSMSMQQQQAQTHIAIDIEFITSRQIKSRLCYLQALVILIPLLGAPYLLTLMGPSRSESPGAYTVFQITRAIVLSSQVLPQTAGNGDNLFLNSEQR